MIEPEYLLTLSREDLLGLVTELQRRIAALTANREVLRAEIDDLTRGEKRQLALFSMDSQVTEPMPHGRNPGAGTLRSREIPPPETMTEPPVDVQVFQDARPGSGGPLAEERSDLA